MHLKIEACAQCGRIRYCLQGDNEYCGWHFANMDSITDDHKVVNFTQVASCTYCHFSEMDKAGKIHVS